MRWGEWEGFGEGLTTASVALLAVVLANFPYVKVLPIGTDSISTISRGTKKLTGDLRCFKVVLIFHDVACVFERPPFLDIQLGDSPTVLIPWFCHHLGYFQCLIWTWNC